jgi:hypothetical protein
LAEHHRANLRALRRIPADPDYLQPEEVLELMRHANEYQLDWSPGLEPDGRPGEVVRAFLVPVEEGEPGEREERRIRCRLEEMLQDPDGVAVPDGDIVWGQQLAGRLCAVAVESIKALGGIRA